jgi:hypothetical protein
MHNYKIKIGKLWWFMSVTSVIQEVKLERLWFEVSPEKKLARSLSTDKPGVVRCACGPSSRGNMSMV